MSALASLSKFLLPATAAALGVSLAAAALAQTRADIERCRAIEDDPRRLDCYDAIRLSTTTAPIKYESVELDELKDYALTYRGRLVEVAGRVRPEGDFLFLETEEGDPSPMPVDIEALARRDREDVLSQCGSGCEATVQGRVRPVNFTTGIVADSVVVH